MYWGDGGGYGESTKMVVTLTDQGVNGGRPDTRVSPESRVERKDRRLSQTVCLL